jgi:uncharacterized membrane protein
MSVRAAITINRPRADVERLWQDSEHRPSYVDSGEATVRFADAPGDRGTEIHVDVDESARGGRLGEAVKKLSGSDPLAQVKDDLKRFKQVVETGEIARSEAVPEGELAKRKLKQRPAQPLDDSEREKAGV